MTEPMNWPAVAHLIRLPNQSGTVLLMLPALWALVVASYGRPPFELVAIFVVGAFLMRSAGVVLNDLADRSIDGRVERTKARPLASGAIDVPVGYVLVIVLLSLAACLLLFLNRLTVLLSPFAVLLAALYPYSKRVIHIPQAVLGVAFGWGAVMAWAAVRNALDLPAWLLFAATICWAITYDSIYALQDQADDARVGVKSSATLFGTWTWLAVAVSSLVMLMCLSLCGWTVSLNALFYLVVGAVAIFLGLQVWRIRSTVQPAEAFRMFKQHMWVGWTILGGFWIGFL